jgi:4-amino-4-deoxy-L-arabinose transferase-like glycosyltransferase
VRGRTPQLWALGAIIVASVLVNFWWLHRFRDGFPVDIDEARYVAFGLRLHDALATGGIGGFWQAWGSQHAFAPLLPLTSVPFYAIFGESLMAAFSSQLLYLGLLIAACFGIGQRVTGSRGAGLLAAGAVACLPAVIDFSRTYQFALTAAALLAASTYALLASERFSHRGWSMTWGALLGLMVLARTMTLAFVPAQLALAVWLVLEDPSRRVTRARNALGGAAVAVATASVWLVTSFSYTITYLTGFGYGGSAERFGSAGSRLSPGYWTRELVDAVRADLYLPLSLLLALGLILGLSAWISSGDRARSRTEIAAALRRWSRRGSFVVTIVAVEGYLALSSSRNEGVGFRSNACWWFCA